MQRRVLVLAVVQLVALAVGLPTRCPICVGEGPLDLLPIATAELPWLAVLAQARAATEPGDAIAGLVYLTLTSGLAALSLHWLLRGGRVGGALVVVGWLGWWTLGITAAAEIHRDRDHEPPCCC